MFTMMERVFPILLVTVFALVIGVFIYVTVCLIRQKVHDDRSPRLTVAAKVVSKRTHVSRHNHMDAGDMPDMHAGFMTSSTWYYATFEVSSGDRMELHLSGSEYGMLAQGDRGMLTFQGSRYLGFERTDTDFGG